MQPHRAASSLSTVFFTAAVRLCLIEMNTAVAWERKPSDYCTEQTDHTFPAINVTLEWSQPVTQPLKKCGCSFTTNMLQFFTFVEAQLCNIYKLDILFAFSHEQISYPFQRLRLYSRLIWDWQIALLSHIYTCNTRSSALPVSNFVLLPPYTKRSTNILCKHFIIIHLKCSFSLFPRIQKCR